MFVLVSGAVDDVDGAVAKLQPLTVKQKPHHIEEVRLAGTRGSGGPHNNGERRWRARQGWPGRRGDVAQASDTPILHAQGYYYPGYIPREDRR